MSFVIVADSGYIKQFVVEEWEVGQLILMSPHVQEAKKFRTFKSAAKYAKEHCGLYTVGAMYDWYIAKQVEGMWEHVGVFAKTPNRFRTVATLRTWLQNVFPFELIGQHQDTQWWGIQFEYHEILHSAELQLVAKPTTVADILHNLKDVPLDVELIDMLNDSEDIYPKLSYAGQYQWELNNTNEVACSGFVRIKTEREVM